MYRSVVLAAALLAGCTIENQFGERPPEWPNSVAPPLPGLTRTDALLQVSTPMVDILWMVDNSCSMSNEQSDLTENFPYFMEFFLGSGLDYHVGVVSSDTIENHNGSQGKLVNIGGLKYIDPNSPSAIELFVQMASLGIDGTYPERGLGATYLALEEKVDTFNAGFYREEAAIHTIIISDEPDFTEPFVITQPEYVDWYEGLKPSKEDRTFSAIVDLNRGTDYKNTALAVGGLVWDIRSDNWPRLLETLGLQAAGLKREYFLSARPVPGTIEVTVENVDGAELVFTEAIVDPATGLVTDVTGDGEPDGAWTYDATRNSITFLEFIPDSLSTVLLHYELLATGQDDPGLDAD